MCRSIVRRGHPSLAPEVVHDEPHPHGNTAEYDHESGDSATRPEEKKADLRDNDRYSPHGCLDDVQEPRVHRCVPITLGADHDGAVIADNLHDSVNYRDRRFGRWV